MNDKLLIPILVINSYPLDLRVAETEHNKDTIFGLVILRQSVGPGKYSITLLLEIFNNNGG